MLTPVTPPCYLTNNQSQNCAQADHIPCNHHPPTSLTWHSKMLCWNSLGSLGVLVPRYPGLFVYLVACVWFFATLWTIACQAPLSVEFFRQEYWSGLEFPSPRDLLDPGIKPRSPVSPALQGDSLPAEPLGKLNIYLFIWLCWVLVAALGI